jgi:hypothetical protein
MTDAVRLQLRAAGVDLAILAGLNRGWDRVARKLGLRIRDAAAALAASVLAPACHRSWNGC